MRLFRFLAVVVFASLSLSTAQSQSLDADAIGKHVEESLSRVMSLAVVGPWEHGDVNVADEGGYFTVTVNDAFLGSAIRVGNFSFTMEPVGAGQYRVESQEFPTSLQVEGGPQVQLEGYAWRGLWAVESQSYRDLSWGYNSLKAADDEGVLSTGAMALALAGEGDQQIDWSLEQLNFIDLDEKVTVSVDSFAVNGSISGPQDYDLFDLYSEVIEGFRDEDGNFNPDDLSKLQSVTSAIDITFENSDADVRISNFNMSVPEEKMTIAIGDLQLSVTANDMLSSTDGSYALVSSMSNVAVNTTEGYVSLDSAKYEGLMSSIDGPRYQSASKKLFSTGENATATMGDLLDVYMNFSDASFQATGTGLSVVRPGSKKSLRAETGSFEFALTDIREPSAVLAMNIRSKDVTLNEFLDKLTSGLIPQDMNMSIRLEDLPLAALKEALADQPIEGGLLDEGGLEDALEAAAPALMGVFFGSPPRVVIPASHVIGNLFKVDVDGAFNIDPSSPLFALGEMQIFVKGFQAITTVAQEVAAGKDRSAAKRASLLISGLPVAQIFGEAAGDDTFVYNIKIDEAGTLTVNGKPMPF